MHSITKGVISTRSGNQKNLIMNVPIAQMNPNVSEAQAHFSTTQQLFLSSPY